MSPFFEILKSPLIISVQVAEAVEKYRAVLMSVEEHERKGQFRTDTLPHLHTLHNLKQVLDTQPESVSPTTRDGQLAQQVSARASVVVSQVV